jgi:hypothetical protein
LDVQVKDLASSIRDLVTGTFRAETREAQNMTMILCGLGLVIVFGLVKPEKATVGSLELKASAETASVILAGTACFFWIRFIYFAYQDMTLHSFTRTSTATIIDGIIGPIRKSHARITQAARRLQEAQELSANEEEIHKLTQEVVSACKQQTAETSHLVPIRNLLLEFYKRLRRIE